MDIRLDRKIDINKLNIKIRWYYMFGIFLIGIVQQNFSPSLVNFPKSLMIAILALFIVINYLFSKIIAKIELHATDFKVHFFSYVQIFADITTFLFVMHMAGGIESISFLYFILSIIFASLIFGFKGALSLALLSGVLVNLLVYCETTGIIFHISRYSASTLESSNQAIALVKSFGIFIFYMIVGVFTGYSSQILINRENELLGKTKILDEKKKERVAQLKKIDETANLLVDRDVELTRINKELDKKIAELEGAEKSQIRAFLDLQAARKKTEEEKEKIGAIISNFIDPIIVFDSEHKISLLNPSAGEIFGLTQNYIGKKVDIKNNFSMENFREIIKLNYKVQTARELKIEDDSIEEITIIQENSDEIVYKVITAKVIGNNGEFYGSMKVFYNLTREKMIDKLKSEFISIAAHQLRTPLSAVKWVIKMVLDEDSGPLNLEQKEMLTKGYQSNERIIVLVNDMLNVSRIEEGRFGYSFEQSDFSEVLDMVISSLEGKLKDKKMKLLVDKPDNIPLVYMDKSKMTMVVQNLTENAVKYTPEFGTVQIGLEVSKKFFRVRVQDNGVGIPAEDKVKLFSKFFRASNVVRLQTEGSGLGLFIVKNIIEKHGGTIICNSEEGKGTEFIFTLPLEKIEIG
jgi:signal transduction histidine kinase